MPATMSTRRPAPPGDDDVGLVYPTDEKRERTLTALDAAWCLVHAVLLVADMSALRELVGFARSPTAAHRFGGHTQFMATWSLALSSTHHAASIVATLFFEPYPHQYIHRDRVRRDRFYSAASKISGLATTFCAAVAAVHLLLLTPLGERESWRAGEWFPYLYTDAIVPLDKFASLVLQVPRHWAYGQGRYISRQTVYAEISFGQSGVHAVLSMYMAWIVVCRAASGRWPYAAISRLQDSSGTGFHFALLLAGGASVVHVLGWLAWRLAAAVAPAPTL